MAKKKKVFRIWKWVQALGYGEDAIKTMEDALKSGWPQKCEGKTLRELKTSSKTSYLVILDGWLTEE